MELYFARLLQMQTKYSIFIIANNNDPKHFHIEATAMKDYRLRFSAIKSQYRRYLKGQSKYKSVFDLLAEDHSYYLLETAQCDCTEIADIVQDLSDNRHTKFENSSKYVPSTLVTFLEADFKYKQCCN